MSFGKTLISIGLVLLVIGLVALLLERAGVRPWARLGRLPGDLRVEREGFRFHFPLMSCLLVSALLTVVFWLFRR